MAKKINPFAKYYIELHMIEDGAFIGWKWQLISSITNSDGSTVFVPVQSGQDVNVANAAMQAANAMASAGS